MSNDVFSCSLIFLAVPVTSDAQVHWHDLTGVYARPFPEVANLAAGIGELYWTRLEQFAGLWDEDKMILLENSRKGGNAAERLPHAIRKSHERTWEKEERERRHKEEQELTWRIRLNYCFLLGLCILLWYYRHHLARQNVQPFLPGVLLLTLVVVKLNQELSKFIVYY
jgi:hypothetical protein